MCRPHEDESYVQREVEVASPVTVDCEDWSKTVDLATHLVGVPHVRGQGEVFNTQVQLPATS